MKEEPFLPTRSPKVLKKLLRASTEISELDRVDSLSQEAAHHLLPMDMQLRTAITAIVAGLEGNDTNLVAHGLHYVMQVEYLLRQLERKMDIVIREGKPPESSR